jgi:hypothetical protein
MEAVVTQNSIPIDSGHLTLYIDALNPVLRALEPHELLILVLTYTRCNYDQVATISPITLEWKQLLPKPVYQSIADISHGTLMPLILYYDHWNLMNYSFWC